MEITPTILLLLFAAALPVQAQISSEAAFALGQIGLTEEAESPAAASARAAAIAALLPAASAPDPALRRAAVEALGKVGGAGEEASLLTAAADPDAGVRGEAALALFRQRLLKRVPEYSTAAVNRLALMIADPDPEVRWRAAYTASRWPEPRMAKALAAASRDNDARTRLFSVRSLLKLGMAPEDGLLSDLDPYVRAETVTAFSAAKAWSRLPDALFADPSAHVRAAAADAAAESGDAARFVPFLEKMAPGTLAEGRALLALAKLQGDAAAGALAKARRDPRWWIAARAYEASALLSNGPEILLGGLMEGDPRVASQALETLAASTSPLALPAIDRVLRDPAAPLELLGTAIDAAVERKDASLTGGLSEAAKSPAAQNSAELRGSIHKVLKDFAPFLDEPRRFTALKTAPIVEMTTEKGTFTIALATEAGNHAAAFVEGVRMGFYDGLTWHRVVTAFVVQGGDPRGSGWGDAGWRLADEINRVPFLRGTVGAPKAGKDTGGCQLFVSLVPTPHLDGRYTAFGRVVSGMEVLDLLEPGDRIIKARLR